MTIYTAYIQYVKCAMIEHHFDRSNQLALTPNFAIIFYNEQFSTQNTFLRQRRLDLVRILSDINFNEKQFVKNFEQKLSL